MAVHFGAARETGGAQIDVRTDGAADVRLAQK